MLRSLLRVVQIALLLLLAAARPLLAQMIEGTVIDRETGRPVEGAVVHLLDLNDRSNTGALTNSSGGFLLRTPGSGQFRLRVERIGFENSFAEVLNLGPSEAREVRLEISPRAITLKGITARGRARGCTTDENAATVARVWEEARKALATVALTQSEELVTYDIESFRRELDPTTGQIRSEQRRSKFGRGENPFQSVSAEELREHGYVQEFRDSTLYFAPDAAVLLSEQFLEGHCFRMSSSPAPDTSLIGLEFEPRGRPDKPDIEGTLWLDRKSAALRFMEYRYVALPRDIPTNEGGGRIEFERVLPSGAWIVRRWHIRMPQLTLHSQRTQNYATGSVLEREEYTLSGLVEEGGEVVSIHSSSRTAASASRVTLTGVVTDSLSGGPLSQAMVYLSGTSFSAMTDAAGRYEIPGVPSGRYVISFTHPRLRSLGIVPLPRQTELGSGSQVSADLATPSLPTVLESYCPTLEGPREGMLTGHVRDAQSGTPIPGARVRVVWTRSELVGGSVSRSVTRSGAVKADLDGARMRSDNHEIEVTADPSGFFRFCGVPVETRLVLHGRAGRASTRGTSRVGEIGVAAQDLHIERQ